MEEFDSKSLEMAVRRTADGRSIFFLRKFGSMETFWKLDQGFDLQRAVLPFVVSEQW